MEITKFTASPLRTHDTDPRGRLRQRGRFCPGDRQWRDVGRRISVPKNNPDVGLDCGSIPQTRLFVYFYHQGSRLVRVLGHRRWNRGCRAKRRMSSTTSTRWTWTRAVRIRKPTRPLSTSSCCVGTWTPTDVGAYPDEDAPASIHQRRATYGRLNQWPKGAVMVATKDTPNDGKYADLNVQLSSFKCCTRPRAWGDATVSPMAGKPIRAHRGMADLATAKCALSRATKRRSSFRSD